jgi:hypothetical protein
MQAFFWIKFEFPLIYAHHYLSKLADYWVHMNKFIAVLITLILAISWPVNAFTVYKKVNKDGSVSYSDKPYPGSIIIKLPPTNRQDPQIKQPVIESTIKKSNDKISASIDIITPSNGDTIRNNAGNLTIMVQKHLSDNKRYSTQLFINDKPYLKPLKGTVFKLKNVDPGIINIKVQLQNRSGNVLATSSQTVVYMHRASVVNAN